MPESQVSIVVSAKETASTAFKKVSDALQTTQKAADDLTSGLSKNQKAWDSYSLKTGQIGSSLDTFIAKEQSAKSAVQGLSDATAKGGNEVSKADGLFARLSSRLMGLTGSATGATGGINGIFADLAGGAAGGGAVATGIVAIGAAALGVGVKVSSEFEQIDAAYTTLLGSSQAAAAAMDQVKQDATRTPFDPQELAQLNLQLTAITHSSGQSEQILMNIGKAMAAMGKNGNDLNGVMTQVFQVLNKGKLEMQDVKPIQNYIDLYGIMSRNLNIPREKLIELQEQGKLTSDMLLEAFEKASNGSGEFANAYETSSKTLANSAQNTFEKLKLGLSDFAEQAGVFDAVKGAFQALGGAMDNSTIAQTFAVIASVIRIAGSGIIGVIEMIYGAIKSLFTLSWQPFLDSVVSAQTRSEDAMNTSWSNIALAGKKSTQDQVEAYRQGSNQMTADDAKKLLQIKQQEDEANLQFTRQQEQNTRQFEQSMTDMIIAHRDKALSLKADIASENAAYMDQVSQRQANLQDDLASLEDQHAKKVADITKEITKEKETGIIVDGNKFFNANQAKLADLQQELDDENVAYSEAQGKRQTQYELDTAADAKRHQDKLDQLQTSLDAETVILQKHAVDVAAVGNQQKDDDITRLKEQYIQQTALANQNHAEELNRIRKQATDQGLTSGSSYGAAVQQAMQGMSGPLSAQSSSIGNSMGESMGKGIAQGLVNGFKPDQNSFLGKLATNLSSLQNDTGNTFKALGAGIADFFGVTYKGQSLSKLMGFAEGGVISRPTLLVDQQTGRAYGQMAEGGRPEAIVPMNQMKSAGMTVTIGTQVFQSNLDQTSFFRQLYWEGKR